MKNILPVLLFAILITACSKNSTGSNSPITYGSNFLSLSTDKAVYKPGETVFFKLNELPPAAFVRYRSLNDIISDVPLANASWNWQPPATDFRGYMIEVYTKENGTEKTQASIAVDVSSNWAKFPRYGFLSEYGQKSPAEMDAVIAMLTRSHVNGVQFYDWQDKHHRPLAGTVAAPAGNWLDIASRPTYRATVAAYIQKCHQAGMQAMFYNLCYGALDDGDADGVQPQWYMYDDTTHNQRDRFTLSTPFKSNIYFLDPSNTAWQQYLANRNNDVYQVFDFDGFHVDQVGERQTVYNYNGNTLNLGATFQPFLVAMKAAHPAKKLVMNAVNQYGQQGSIGNAPVEFMYSEVWSGNESYKDLATIIKNNAAWSSGKSTVLTAYMNYNKANSRGTFNTAGVLLTNAVIFAFGGSHLELGEHMLCKEYFPNNNLSMNEDLKKAIIHYYDFLVGYENILRDGGDFNTTDMVCTNGKMNLGNWPPELGKVALQGKQVGVRRVFHFINLANAINFDWRDTDGNQPVPDNILNASMELSYSGTASKLWVASPDINGGIPKQIEFTQTGNKIKFTLPELKYWDMLVVE